MTTAQTILLQTKLQIPPVRTTIVLRPRLIAKLSQGLTRKLTLLSASPGFGKTTLLSAWLAELDGRFAAAWLSLDNENNDPQTFWRYVVAALQRVRKAVGEQVLALLNASQPVPETALMMLLNDLCDVQQDVVLVLDDYHVIVDESIHTGLLFLLEHLPTRIHLVVASRVDPPWPLARLRARDMLTELGVDDLRFTATEAHDFLSQLLGQQLPSRMVEVLADRTEGWAAGLQLAGLSLRSQQDMNAFVEAFRGSHRYVLDYLAEEVLYRLSEATRQFLLQTSILERMTASLCDEVTGRKDSQHLLKVLEQSNLFIAPLDERREWYRYHQLFSDVLREHLRRTQADMEPLLHVRASQWYERQHMLADAMHHAAAASHWEQATHLIIEYGHELIGRGEIGMVLKWLAMMPEEHVRSNPRLGVARAWGLTLTYQFERLESDLQMVERVLQQLPDAADRQTMLGEVALMRATQASAYGDTAQTLHFSTLALTAIPEDNLSIRALAALSAGNAYLAHGSLKQAFQHFQEARHLNAAFGNTYAENMALWRQGQIDAIQGRLQQAYATFSHIVTSTVSEHAPAHPIAGAAYIGMADVLYERNDLAQALQYAKEGIVLRARENNASALSAAHFLLARIYLALHDDVQAERAFEHAERLLQKGRFSAQVHAQLDVMRVRYWLAQNDLRQAERWLQDTPSDREGVLHHWRELEHIARALILLARNEYAQAQAQVETVLAEAEQEERVGNVIELLSIQALATHGQGNVSRALPVLKRALALAESEGYVRTFTDKGPALAQLLLRLLPQIQRATSETEAQKTPYISMHYLQTLLQALHIDQQTIEQHLREQGPVQEGPDPLSERELEVLRLLAAGASNQEIAQRLVMTVGTVKWHVNHIYGKLGVHSRTQAAVQAKKLGLLH